MDPDLIDLISACKGENHSPERLDQLRSRLRQDDAFQQAFVDEIRILGMLKAVQSMEPRWLTLQDKLGWVPPSLTAEEDLQDAFMLRLRDVVPRRRSAPWTWRAVTARAAGAVALVLVGVATALVVPRWLPKAPVASPVPIVARSYPRVEAERALAIVVKLDRVRWEVENSPHPVEGDLVAPGRFQIRSGRVTLSLLSGVVLIAEGPADLDLVSIDRIFCREGNLRTRVPKGAEGIVISSPSTSILDLGTEFGLKVEPGGKSRVRVFEGLAEAVVHTKLGSENLTQYVRSDKEYEIDPEAGAIRPVPDSEGFAASLNVPIPSLVLDRGYAGAVLAVRPWSYWRFESLNQGATPNEVPGQPRLRAVGTVRLTDTSDDDNHSAEFLAGEDLQYLVMDGLWQPTPDPGYAVELWFLPEAIDHSSLISLPAPADTNHHQFFLEMGSRNRHTVHTPASVRFLDRWPPALGGGHNLYSKRPYVPFRWHHVVGQMNGGRMELYLDGEPTYSREANLGHPTAACQVLLGRLSTVPLDREDTRWFYGRPFVGRLDEVAIYNHPLPIEEIRRHHRLATSRVRINRPVDLPQTAR